VFTAPVTVTCALQGRYIGIGFDSVPQGSYGNLALAEVEAYETAELLPPTRVGPFQNDGSLQ